MNDYEYEVLDIDELAESVDWEKTRVLEGIIVEKRSVEYKIGKKKTSNEVLTIIDDEGKKWGVWKSHKLAALFDYFDIVKGNRVKIEFLGQIKIKGSQKLNNFKVMLPKTVVQEIKQKVEDIPF